MVDLIDEADERGNVADAKMFFIDELLPAFKLQASDSQ